jgi:hypothetical protein
MPKRKLDEIIEEISSLKSIQYIPLKQIQHTPQLHLPSYINIDSPSAIFSLFFSDEAFQIISNSTNIYAKIHKAQDDHARPWQDTNLIEIKVLNIFF